MENGNTELIEKYLLNQLEGIELSEFLDKMKNDQLFSEQVSNHKLILDGITSFGNKELKKRLQEISTSREEVSESKSKKRLFSYRILIPLAAAMLAGILYFTGVIDGFKPLNYEDSKYLMAQNFTPIDLTVTRSESEKLDISSFLKKDYTTSIAVFEEYLKSNPNRFDVSIALANSYYMQAEYRQTIERLKPIIDTENPLFIDQARWYSALALLKLNSLEGAKNHLNILAKDKNADFNREAIELMSDIE